VREVAGSIEDLTTDWMSSALATDVRTVVAQPIGTGQTSSTFRLTIDADNCPATVVVKLADGEEGARRRVVVAHRNEVGFYQSMASTLAIRVPECFYAAISEDGSRFTLLLEDLSPREPGRQADGCSPIQSSAAVRYLAGLHASWWNDEALSGVDFLVPITVDRAAFLTELTQTATNLFIERYEERLASEDVATLQQMSDVLTEWQLNAGGPFSIVHGDYRPDNLMFSPDGQDVVAVDWQTVTAALPARDLAYFIGTSLPTEQRRSQEEGLVSEYYEELRARGVHDYAYERCVADYGRGHLQGPMITVLGSMTSAETRETSVDEMFLSMASRSCSAVRDHGSIEAHQGSTPH
jgi:aminoglycoside/choline kinase family phosphotransferase